MIHSTAFIFSDCQIGKNCRIGAHVVIGSLGLATQRHFDATLLRVHSKGIVILDDNVDVGANTVIHRGRDGNTVIGKGSFIGPNCNVGHDVKIGENCIVGTGTLLCGFVEIQDNTRINPSCTVKNRVKIGSNVLVGIGSLVMHDVPDNTTVIGRPAKNIQQFRQEKKVWSKLLSSFDGSKSPHEDNTTPSESSQESK